MVVIRRMYFVVFLLCSFLLVSQRPARGEDPHATIRLCTKNSFFLHEMHKNKYFELKNSWGANGAPQTRTTCQQWGGHFCHAIQHHSKCQTHTSNRRTHAYTDTHTHAQTHQHTSYRRKRTHTHASHRHTHTHTQHVVCVCVCVCVRVCACMCVHMAIYKLINDHTMQWVAQYFEVKNSWGADVAPQTRTTCQQWGWPHLFVMPFSNTLNARHTCIHRHTHAQTHPHTSYRHKHTHTHTHNMHCVCVCVCVCMWVHMAIHKLMHDHTIQWAAESLNAL